MSLTGCVVVGPVRQAVLTSVPQEQTSSSCQLHPQGHEGASAVAIFFSGVTLMPLSKVTSLSVAG